MPNKIIFSSDIVGTTISEVMTEIENNENYGGVIAATAQKYGCGSADAVEAIATHFVITDADFEL